jgi:hypothetical protein
MYAVARPATLELQPWHALTAALAQAFCKLNATANVICGTGGDGQPLITDERITFNGNSMGRAWWRNLGKPVLAPDTPRDDAHEDFDLIRALPSTRLQGYYHQHTTTEGKPYELGVRAALLLLRHHYPQVTLITTAPASMNEWHHTWEILTEIVPGIALPPECHPRISLLDYSPKNLRFMTQPRRVI